MKYYLRQLTLAALLAAAPGAAFAADDGWQTQVGEALGKTGSAAPGGVYRVGLPRTDLKVTLDGVALRAGFALGGWLAFEKMSDQGMVMGDVVLTMDEVAPVMTKLAAGGIDVTALHNHLLRNQPFTMYMHVLGHGDPVKLAAALTRRSQKARPRFPRLPPRRHRRRRSILTRPLSTRPLAPKAPITAASTSSASPAQNPSRTTGWTFRHQWVQPMPSISSRPAAARQRSPAISC